MLYYKVVNLNIIGKKGIKRRKGKEIDNQDRESFRGMSP